MRDIDRELLEAVRAQDVTRVTAALAAGADVNVHDPQPILGEGNTPLHDAATGDVAIVQMLLDAGAHVNARCDAAWTPLMRACNLGHLPAAELLLAAGADPHLRNAEGYTAWGRVPNDCTALLALLKERGAANSRKDTLREAVFPEHANLHGILHTQLNRNAVVAFFAASGWSTRECGFAEHEIRAPFAELVLESEDPVLLHGTVADILVNAPRIAEILQRAEISFSLECYDADGALVGQLKR
jgi:hypothetical protein